MMITISGKHRPTAPSAAVPTSDPRDVDAVYNIVQQTQNLSNQHRERCPDDVSGYGSMFEINSFHLFPHSLLFHLLFSIVWRILYVNYCFYIEIE